MIFSIRNHQRTLFNLVGLLCLPWILNSNIAHAEQPTGVEIAKRLSESVVTVRYTSPVPAAIVSGRTTPSSRNRELVSRTQGNKPTRNSLATQSAGSHITVCSATRVANELYLTFASWPIKISELRSADYRITLPSGEQIKASARVVDLQSNLILLRAHKTKQILQTRVPKKRLQTFLELSQQLPEIGATVYTAAASGLEKPLISKGVLSSAERPLVNSSLPPLLVCDISTTSSSSGAALVDAEAKLIGIIAVTSAPGAEFGWSRAISLRYVQRVLAAYKPGEHVTLLMKKRPLVGMTLAPGKLNGTVFVRQVIKNGPAEKAGVQNGDQLIEVDGREIRSVYQAVMIIRKGEPGDQLELRCLSLGKKKSKQPLEEKKYKLILGEAPSVKFIPKRSTMPQQRSQSIQLRMNPGNRIERSNQYGKAELQIEQGVKPQKAAAQGAKENDKIRMLEQLQSNIRFMGEMQAKLQTQEHQAAENAKLIQLLKQQIKKLNAELSEKSTSASGKKASQSKPE